MKGMAASMIAGGDEARDDGEGGIGIRDKDRDRG
jgi:hypothetical protein